MSFSYEVKNEIARIECKDCCQKAESYGLLLFGRFFTPNSISIMTEHGEVARKYADAADSITGVMPAVNSSRSGKFSVNISDKEQKRKILSEYGHEGREIGLRINRANLADECCVAAFIRGVFLACGTVTSPEKEYHLEFSVSFRNLSADLAKLFDEFDELTPKTSLRGGAYMVYFKDSSMIEDVLALIGATNSSLELMSVKIYKDIRNNVNRKVNFENANIDRSVNASRRQISALARIEGTSGIGALPEDLRELASLRLENPEMSLSELGQALSEPLTRSAVNHRLNKIMRIADKL